jgi:phosphate:Na+ symporter
MAIGSAGREALRMVDVLDRMLRGALQVFETGDRRQMTEIRHLDGVLDALNAAIKEYLVSLDNEEMRAEDQRRVFQILAFITNVAQAGDLVENGIVRATNRMQKRELAFSPQGRADLHAMLLRLQATLQSAAAIFMTEDARAARQLASEKEVFRDFEEHATEAHFERLRAGRVDSAETSAFHLDLIRDMKQINSHLVAAAAYPVLKSQGELLPSRLRTSADLSSRG